MMETVEKVLNNTFSAVFLIDIGLNKLKFSKFYHKLFLYQNFRLGCVVKSSDES